MLFLQYYGAQDDSWFRKELLKWQNIAEQGKQELRVMHVWSESAHDQLVFWAEFLVRQIQEAWRSAYIYI